MKEDEIGLIGVESRGNIPHAIPLIDDRAHV